MRFVTKNIRKHQPYMFKRHMVGAKNENVEQVLEENNDNKKIEVMTTKEKIEAASEILRPKVKRIKSDKGLIERTESSTTIITEENKELLTD